MITLISILLFSCSYVVFISHTQVTMDLVLDACDHFFFTPYVYPAALEPDDWRRQLLSLYLVTTIGGIIMYLTMATFSYVFIFDKSLMQHPKFLKNQVQLEIKYTLSVLPFMSIPTILLFLLEVRGYSKLYYKVEDVYGWLFVLFSLLTFLVFTDSLIYWIHRGLHNPLVYARLHKAHHKWKIPSPFASHAFHPMDGFLQSVPYHIYPFLFPLNKVLYIMLFVFVNMWTVSIHDGNYSVPDILKPFINGSAHHTDHHLFYNYNYGQFFTFWDRISGSFKNPSAFEGESPGDFVRRMLAVKN